MSKFLLFSLNIHNLGTHLAHTQIEQMTKWNFYTLFHNNIYISTERIAQYPFLTPKPRSTHMCVTRVFFPVQPTHMCVDGCRVEELALPTRAIQLSGKVLSTDEAASAELREAEAVHRTRSSRRLFKAAPTTPCVCRELHSLRQVCVINV